MAAPAAETPPVSEPRQIIPWRIKAPLLGLTFALDFTQALAVIFSCIFLTNTAELDLDKTAWVEGLLRIFVSVLNPFILLASDFSTAVVGRRRIFLITASIPYAACCILVWWKPTEHQWVLFIYFLLVKFFQQALHSLLNIPLIALISEIIENPLDRLQFHRLRALAGALGWLSSIGTLALIGFFFNGNSHDLAEADSEYYRYFMTSGFGGLLAVIFSIWTFRETSLYTTSYRNWEHLVPEAGVLMLEMGKMLSGLFKIRAYLFALLQNTASTAAYWSALSLLPYYLSSYKGHHLEEVASFLAVSTMAGVVIAGAAVFMTRWIEKTTLYAVGSVVWIILHLILLFDNRVSDPTPYTILLGFGGATAIGIPTYLLGDSTHFVEWRLKQRSEALLMGLADSLRMAIFGMFVFFIQLSLSGAGYTNSTLMKDRYRQPESALRAMKHLISFIPMSLIIVSVIINFFSPLSRIAVIRVLHALKRRRRLEAMESQDNLDLRDSQGSEQPVDLEPYLDLASSDDARALIIRQLMPNSGQNREFSSRTRSAADDDERFFRDRGPDEKELEEEDDTSDDASSSTSDSPNDDQFSGGVVSLSESQVIPRPTKSPVR